MALSITPTAQSQLKQLIQARHGKDTWLRLGIRGGGCSGLSYVMTFVPGPEEKDRTLEFDGIQVCVDKKSYLFLNVVELDFTSDNVRTEFLFNNPDAKRSCSCGMSFAI